MVIRGEQMAALSDAAAVAFEDRVLGHLKRCFPELCGEREEADLRGAIRYGIQRAGTYGVVMQRDVCRYIDLMMVFGRDFDRGAGLPGAAEILQDTDFESGTARIEFLYARAKSARSLPSDSLV